MKNKVKFLCLILFVILPHYIYANGSTFFHFSYRHLYGLTWEVITSMYTNCDYYGMGVSFQINNYVHDTCNYQSKVISYGKRADTIPNGLPYRSNCYIDNCVSTLTMCDSPFNATGYNAWRQVDYIDTIVLPEACGLWKFSRGAVSASNWRDPMITNITPQTYTYYNEAILNADSTNPNNSSLWQRPMFMYACKNEPTQWYLPVTDLDGDSLVYSMIAPRERDQQGPNPLDTLIYNIPYVSPFSLTTEPFETNESWQFDPTIPAVRFNGVGGQLALLTFKVEEYRHGAYMGATFRDVLINTIQCGNPVPLRSVDTLFSQHVTFSDGDTIEVYAGQQVLLNVSYYNTSPSAILYHESNIPTVLPNANYTQSFVGGTDSILTSLQWTPTLSDTGIYLLVTTIKDTGCAVAQPRIPQDYFHRLIVHGFPQGITISNIISLINLYPNPATNIIHVEMNKSTSYTILNSQGISIFKGMSNKQGYVDVDVSGYNGGLYFFKAGGRVVPFTVFAKD